MPYDKNDPALAAVKDRLKKMGAQDAYYDVFGPKRNETITKEKYDRAVMAAVEKLGSIFSRIQVQGEVWSNFSTPKEAAKEWEKGGWDFLHIHKSEDSAYRVYIPADLRKISEVIKIVWETPLLTGFKVAGYADANNRSDVIVAWVKEMVGVEYIAKRVTPDMLHGMRPPGSEIVYMGCLIGYSREVPGSSVGTEVTRDLSS